MGKALFFCHSGTKRSAEIESSIVKKSENLLNIHRNSQNEDPIARLGGLQDDKFNIFLS